MDIKQKILLAVSDVKERSALSAYLADWGVDVDLALDGNEALAKGLSNPYLMILVNPDLAGIRFPSFISDIKQKYKETEILISTRESNVENAVDFMKAGAFDVLKSPVDHSQMSLILEQMYLKADAVNVTVPQESSNRYELITEDKTMLRLLEMVKKVADSTASILIQGESGTGKELIARFIHRNSSRSQKPFVAINCAALPENLLESELFGHEKGAFTGAASRKPGKFELADGGTILLDEVTEMQMHLQSKLLRVLQEKEFERIGGIQTVKVDVRIVATTNRMISEAVSNNEFREDLYYRLNTIPVRIPALRDRRSDIRILAEYFIRKYNEIDSRSVKKMTSEALVMLENCAFKGNVRELENMIQRAVLLSDGHVICPGDLLMEDVNLSTPDMTRSRESSGSSEFEPGPLKDMEEKMIYSTLDKTRGNRTKAADILGISVRTLRNKLNEYKIKSEK